MDGFRKEIIGRLPLAESVTLLFLTVADEELLSRIWEEHRGRCFERELSFGTMVHLISDALLSHKSGRRSFQKNKERGILGTSLQAVYDKLGRLPIAVSQAFLEQSTSVLRDAFPDWSSLEVPKSLQEFRLCIYDGKAVKRVAHRLKLTRPTRGGLLGGRALVVQDWQTGMAIAMHGDPDGEANDVKHVGQLAPKIQSLFQVPILHIGDSGFCDLVQPHHFRLSPDDHFLVRHHPKVSFHKDAQAAERTSTTEAGETVTESWGWLGSDRDARRMYVRRIELFRWDDESVVLITSLLDANQYHVADMLFAYRQRWGIEEMFQQVTEVFGLSHLIGTSPQATLFQFAFCLLLYNMIQVIRGYVAQARQCEPAIISPELLFRDVEEELIAWNKLLTPEETQEYFEAVPTAAQLKRRLTSLLSCAWSETWIASPNRTVRNSNPGKKTKTHTSVYRLLHGVPAKDKSKHAAVYVPKNMRSSNQKRS